MSAGSRLKEIASLTNLTFDPQNLRNIIRSYSKVPKMISVAALFKVNNLSLKDGQKCLEIETPHGKIEVPKDGYSDGYRLQEAVVSKTVGGKGMIYLPAIDGVMVGSTPAEKWGFKEAWDARTSSTSTAIWGGSFQTKAIDYDDDDDYSELNLTQDPHYYNVLLTNREKRDFSAVNPSLNYIECTGDCLPKKHYHGVHGLYRGAVVNGTQCAPPFELLPIWNKLQRFDPESAALVETAVKTAAVTLTPLVSAPASSDPPKSTVPKPSGEGAQALAEIISQTRPWAAILETYRNPKTAKWASTDGFTTSKSGQNKIKQKWNAIYSEQMLPLFEGEGTPVVTAMQRAWDLDTHENKALANYIVRRMCSGDSGLIENQNGNLTV